MDAIEYFADMARKDRETMNFETAVTVERKNRKKQKATKYSDSEIAYHISNAEKFPAEMASAEALVGIAKILYNKMIDDRWK